MFKSRLACSFCRRNEAEVSKLVAGPRVYICDRCATEVIRIINESDSERLPSVSRQLPLVRLLERLQNWWRHGMRRGSSLSVVG
jgi:ATP-dependent protease Clp ATPase subunit